jgi:sucrose-6-phosphate hydrolase SacC (GH32 family)
MVASASLLSLLSLASPRTSPSSPPPPSLLPPCATDAPRAWPKYHIADWDLRLTNASLCCFSGHRPPCSGPCSETNPMGGLGAHDVNALFSYGGLAHVMNQRQTEQSAQGKAGFSHLVSRDWVRWERLPNALAAGSYDGSATVVPGGSPVIMFDCATKICPVGSNLASNTTAITRSQQHPDDIPVIGVARPANLSDPTLREWITASDNPIDIDIPGEFVGPSKLWHNSSGVAFMAMNAGNSVIGLFSSTDPQLHAWRLENPKFFATGGGGAVVFLPLPSTISGDSFADVNGTNHVCGSCDPSLCFVLGRFDSSGNESFTQTIPGLHCTDLGYDMGGFFVYSESGVVPPEGATHKTASPGNWGKAKSRFVQQGWIAELAALTVVRELRFDPVQQSLVSLPVAELASLRSALQLNREDSRRWAIGALDGQRFCGNSSRS